MQLGVIIGLLFGVVIAFFAFLNTATVTVNYYFGQMQANVALVVLLSAMAGALAVGLFGLITQIRTGFAVWGFKNKLQRLTKEVEELKEQKRALSDDLSQLQAECESLAVRREKKDEQLQGCREAAGGEGGQFVETEENMTDES